VSYSTKYILYFKKLKIMTVPCTYIYEILLYTKMYLNKFKTNSIFHTHDTRNKSDLFISGHNTTYLNTVSHTTACLLTINFLTKLSVTGIMKFKKMIINFLLEKSFYSVE